MDNNNSNLDKFSFIQKNNNSDETSKSISKRNPTIEKRDILSKLDDIISLIEGLIKRLDKIDKEGFNEQIEVIRLEYGRIIDTYNKLVSQQDKSKGEKTKRFRTILITITIQIVTLFIGIKQGSNPDFQNLWIGLLKLLSGGM